MTLAIACKRPENPFMNPNNDGTAVSKGQTLIPEVPCYIVKKNQVLISLSSLDFSYIVEENISEIFNLLHPHKGVVLLGLVAISYIPTLSNLPFR